MKSFAELRTEAGLSQSDAAGWLELDQSRIDAYEAGLEMPSAKELQILSGLAATRQIAQQSAQQRVIPPKVSPARSPLSGQDGSNLSRGVSTLAEIQHPARIEPPRSSKRAPQKPEVLQNETETLGQLVELDKAIVGDSITKLRDLPNASVHLILSDIPYGIGIDEWDVLHDNTNSAFLGTSPAQVKAGAIFKKRGKPINGWSEADREIPRQYYEWCSSWAGEWLRVLKPGGSAIVFAGRRFAHRCICAMEDADFSFKDMLAWMRERAPHRAQRVSVVFERRGDQDSAKTWNGWRVGNLRPTFEPILWFTKPYKIGSTIADNALSHAIGPFNEDAFVKYAGRPDNIIECGFSSGEAGLHPTQKPVRLMQALIELATRENQIVLDPFAGSGSTLLAAKLLRRRFIGYELDPRFVEICERRLKDDDLLSLMSCA